MPASFLARHRTICAVLEEIRQLALDRQANGDAHIIELCDEAKDYAQRMSKRLMEYKLATELTGPVVVPMKGGDENGAMG